MIKRRKTRYLEKTKFTLEEHNFVVLNINPRLNYNIVHFSPFLVPRQELGITNHPKKYHFFFLFQEPSKQNFVVVYHREQLTKRDFFLRGEDGELCNLQICNRHDGIITSSYWVL